MSSSCDQLSLFEESPMPEPGACEYERGVFAATESKPKSRCVFRGVLIWTNCRECGHCVWEGLHLRGVSSGLAVDDGGGEDE